MLLNSIYIFLNHSVYIYFFVFFITSEINPSNFVLSEYLYFYSMYESLSLRVCVNYGNAHFIAVQIFQEAVFEPELSDPNENTVL